MEKNELTIEEELKKCLQEVMNKSQKGTVLNSYDLSVLFLSSLFDEETK